MIDSSIDQRGQERRDYHRAGSDREPLTARRWFRLVLLGMVIVWMMACIIATILLLG